MLTLTDEQVRRALNPEEVIQAIERAFAHDYPDAVRMPVRTQMEIPSLGVFLVMPCYDSALPALGLKLVFVREGGTAEGARVRSAYALLDPVTGELQALFDANHLTEVRTAATSAVATKHLARKNSATLGIFGTGRQACAHLNVLQHVLPIQRVLVCGSSQSSSAQFAALAASAHAVNIQAADARTVVTESDVICTCTTSNEPLFDGHQLRSGTHLNLVGAFRPAAREVDDETVRRGRVVVDTYEGALAEAGDLLIPMQRGVIARDHIVADLHEIVSSRKSGRQSEEEITVFKSVGCALEDLVTAHLVYHRASRSS